MFRFIPLSQWMKPAAQPQAKQSGVAISPVTREETTAVMWRTPERLSGNYGFCPARSFRMTASGLSFGASTSFNVLVSW
jgi:hypothetical protein